MTRLGLLCPVVLAACGAVHADADGGVASIDANDPGVDAGPRAERCNGLDDDEDGEVDEDWLYTYVDDFDDALGTAKWTVMPMSKAPMQGVAGSEWAFTDAGTYIAPSMAGKSWVYDLGMDRGNQLSFPFEIGEGDFELVADMHWVSSTPQYGLAVVALVGEEDLIDFYVGLYDPTELADSVAGMVRVNTQPGEPALFEEFANRAVHAVHVEVTRRADQLTVTIPGLVDSPRTVTMKQHIKYLSIVTVAHQFADFPFFALDHLAVCGSPR